MFSNETEQIQKMLEEQNYVADPAIIMSVYLAKTLQKPMVFGVFAASKSAPKNKLKSAHQELYSNVTNFYESQLIKEKVIDETSMRSGFSKSRVRDYFSEVTNLLDGSSIAGLEKFLTEVCEVNLEIEWLEV
mgnify:CR=1 FL=1